MPHVPRHSSPPGPIPPPRRGFHQAFRAVSGIVSPLGYADPQRVICLLTNTTPPSIRAHHQPAVDIHHTSPAEQTLSDSPQSHPV